MKKTFYDRLDEQVEETESNNINNIIKYNSNDTGENRPLDDDNESKPLLYMIEEIMDDSEHTTLENQNKQTHKLKNNVYYQLPSEDNNQNENNHHNNNNNNNQTNNNINITHHNINHNNLQTNNNQNQNDNKKSSNPFSESEIQTQKADETSSSSSSPPADPKKATNKSKPLNVDSKQPTPSQKSTNPFDEPVPNNNNKTSNNSKSLNPFADDESTTNGKQSTNPFDPNYVAPPSSTTSTSASTKNQSSRNHRNSKSTSTNPFDFDDKAVSKNSSPSTSAAGSNKSPNLIHSMSSPALMSTFKQPTSPKSRSSLTRFTEHSPEYPDLVQLLLLGFLPNYAYSALMTNKDFNLTLTSLRNDLFNSLTQKTSPNWYPPILTRIGSWMPSQANSSSRILYYVKVQLNHSDIAYVITKRYSEFVAFYQKLSPHIHRNSIIPTSNNGNNSTPSSNGGGAGGGSGATSDSTTTTSPANLFIQFVDDRIRGYLLGTNEELCNRRQDMLHKWLSYLCLSERMMTDPQIHNLLVEFLLINNYVKRIPVLTGTPEKPVVIQIERTPREYL